MKCIFSKKASPSLLEEVNKLIRKCSLEDAICYPFYTEEDFSIHLSVLALEEDAIVGFLLCTDDEFHESFGMVLPQFRKKGIFTEMLSFLHDNESIDNLTLYGRKSYPGITECANSLGFIYENSEYLMEYTGSKPAVTTSLEVESEESTYYYYQGDNYIGQCSIYKEQNTINLFNIYVEENHRNQGYGKEIVQNVIKILFSPNIKFRLQVNGANLPAINCYRACGFITTDSITYFSKEVL